MTERIRDFLRRRRDEGRDDGPCLVVDLDVVRDNYRGLRQGTAGQPGVLRRQGEPGARAVVASGGDGLLLRHRFGRRDRDGARGRRRGRPHFLRQHHQEGAGHRPRLRARGAAVRGRLQGRGREGRPCRARLARLLPHPLRLRRGGMAAVAQVRLRAGHGRRRARARVQARAGAARRVVPCRLAAAQPARLGPGARFGGGRVQGLRRARHQPGDGQSGRRVSRPNTCGTCRR